ncbi:MAG: carboxypeptidase regulatory-like domain-containing protein [Candidatus Tectomicrobia bacterium]|uniref:Carboxypeptidase regulatory-like domain-containing protein n=1 Tax=Tectimicrobiota bacterium TaxID=2528274 RepID=A0A932CN20_UNCTE|nr:carboxypeptidase regulatory-like domain-containing protein [Candidatus Tectomicrobia bacterium]
MHTLTPMGGAGRQSPRKRAPWIVLFLLLAASLAQGGPLGQRHFELGEPFFQERPEAAPPPVLPPPLAPTATPTLLYSHGEPTDEEQFMLELINRARANPPAEGVRLADTPDPEVQRAMTSFNVDRNQLKADFADYPVQPPLAFNAKLLQAARRHSNDMAAHDFQGHEGSEEDRKSTPDTRITDAGYLWQSLGENVYAYAESVFYGHAGFVVDWGVPSLGHRRNAINFDNSNRFREVGISIVHEDKPGTEVGPLVISQDFAEPLNRGSIFVFIVGVVFHDANANGFYDPGEGRSGVTILPDRGTYYAVTSASGGYAIPIEPGAGEVTLQVSGGGLPEEQSRGVSIGSVNVKADVLAPPPPVAHTLSGRVTIEGAGLEGVVVSAGERSTTTDASGRYRLTEIFDGSYTLTATKAGFRIVPASFTNPVEVAGRDLSDLNFTATLREEEVVLHSITEADGAVGIAWDNPEMDDLDHVRILRRPDRFPTSPTDSEATIAFEGNATQFTDTPLGNGAPYYYGIYVADNADNYSAGRFFTAAPTDESGFDRLLVTLFKATVKGPGKDSLTLTVRFNHTRDFEASNDLRVEVGEQISWLATGFTGQGSLKSTDTNGSTATVNNRMHLLTVQLKKQDFAGKLAAGDVRVRIAFGTFEALLTIPLDAKLSYTSRLAPSDPLFLVQSASLKDVATKNGDSFTLLGTWSAPDLPDLLAAFYGSEMPMSLRIKSGDHVIFESQPDQFSSRSNWVLSPGRSLVFNRPKAAEGKAGIQKLTLLFSTRSFALVGSKATLSTSPLNPSGTSPATLVLIVGDRVYRTDLVLTGNGTGGWKY